MTANPIGLFIMGQGVSGAQRTTLLDHVTKANYKTVSVLDDFGLCVEIKNRLPDCVVIYRSSDFEPKAGPLAVNYLITFLNGIQAQDKRIVVMVNCEQGFDLDRVAMWSDMVIQADKMGWKLCVGNVSSGSVKCGQGSDQNDWFIMGARLLQTLAAHKGHYLGWHEYTFPFPWSVSNGEFGTPDKPPDKIDWTKPQYHIGRNVQGIQNACKALKIDYPQCIATETLIDTMGDITAHFGYKADGYKTLTSKWAEWFPGKDRGDVLADFHIWVWEHVYAPAGFVIGTHTYCYGNAGNNPQWADYQVDNDAHYLTRMESYRSIPAPVVLPAPAPPIVTPPPVEAKPPEPPVIVPDPASKRAQLQQRLVITQQARQLVIDLLQKEIDELIAQLKQDQAA